MNLDIQSVQSFLIVIMLFGVILVSVGVATTRGRYVRDMAALKNELETLKAEIEALKRK